MAITDTSAKQLIINQLTREQYNNLGNNIANDELYIIDENILSSANAYFKNKVDQKDFQISAYADSDVVNKAYINKVVSNITEVINTKQNNLTPGSYIKIENNTISVSAVTTVSSEINANDDGLTTGKAVHDYVENELTAKQDKLTADSDSHITITTGNKISVSDVTTVSGDINNTDTGLTTGKAVHDYVEAQIDSVNNSLTEHTGNANIHVTAEQKTNWTSTSATVATNKTTWDKAGTALQEISSATTDYITIVNKDTISAIITTDDLDKITNDTKGIVPPSVIAALNTKVNELEKIPHFSVVVAKSIDVTNKTYVPSNSTEAVSCVENTVYLVADENSAAGAHIEYLCYGETRVIEQIGTTEIDLSDYAKTTAISGGFDEHGVKVNLSNGKLTGGVTPGSITQGNTSVVTGGAVYEKLEEKQDNLKPGSYITIADDNTISVSAVTTVSGEINANDDGLTTGKAVHDYVAAMTASGSHEHAIDDVTGLQDALDAKQNNLTAGSYIKLENDTISVSAVTTTSAAVELGNTGLTTGNAVREALNSMIVFRKHT